MKLRFEQYLSEAKFKLIDFSKQNNDEDQSDDSDEDKSQNINNDLNKQSDDSYNDSDDQNQSEDNDDEEDEGDPDRQGVIRTIKDAHLIYKRKDGDGTFTELWEYDISKGTKDEFRIRSAILNGTDIDHKTSTSPDNKQQYTLWNSNTRQMMQISGLPN
jgi:hypothetical protein